MILQELVKYYERKLADGEISREGFEVKEIPYLIEIKDDGTFVRFVSTWLDEKKKRAKKFSIPKAVVRSRGIVANLLWDNTEYIFGIDSSEKQKAFIAGIQLLKDKSGENSLQGVLTFLKNTSMKELEKDILWNEIVETKANLTFKLFTENDIICSKSKIIDALLSPTVDPKAEYGLCMITGKEGVLERLHSKIGGVAGANSTGANIVSFNQTSFESYDKEQGSNAPTSKYTNFAYGTSLNSLLAKDSRQKLLIGDATTLFWSESKNELEDAFAFLLKPTVDEKEIQEEEKARESKEVQAVKEHFESPFSGKYKSLLNDNTKFYILGLAPNAARISIRFWYPSTVGEVSQNLDQHFKDLKLEYPPFETGFISINRILRSTALLGKLDNINPVLAGKLITSILSGGEYPRALLLAIVIRMKADKKISFVRVSTLKAIHNRKCRLDRVFKKSNNEVKEIKENMDETNINIAYRLGRLFAVMEKMQQNAINADSTIKDRYYTSASTRPASVFPVLFSMSNHHASKLGHKSIFLEKLKGQILEPLNGNFPKTFRLEDQGLFALGYYQQKQDLFKKKEETQIEGDQK